MGAFVLPICLGCLRAHPKERPPCSTLPKVCEDCESGPADVLIVIASIGWDRSASACVLRGPTAPPCGFFQLGNSLQAFCGPDTIVGERFPCDGHVQKHLPVLG